ncbi:hypothetical protein [Catenuloplanes atrovinosus]|uniref:Uncharacterized protein n=1 Tax=Catenuloplanes atrovinosus TaxID=137266 RepID=A0AAE3YPK3_9ACTN|nr:hypothetical protein [Catenuloplanes atrovinosus]MDR7276295.1 hypothetical protein [Catenuloplanes atrovinosus]
MTEVDHRDRRAIVTALDRESRADQQRILDTPESFRAWLRRTLPAVHARVAHRSEELWAWLRLAFA